MEGNGWGLINVEPNIPAYFWRNCSKPLRIEISTRNTQNKKQECQQLDSDKLTEILNYYMYDKFESSYQFK
jgi:hypothetical protein